MIPRRGDVIQVLPYGPGIVDKILTEGQVVVTIDRVIKRRNGEVSNQVICELHPVWIAKGAYEDGN